MARYYWWLNWSGWRRLLGVLFKRRCDPDWDDLVTEIVEDNAKLIVAAQEKANALNTQFPGLNITWRELACLPTPDNLG